MVLLRQSDRQLWVNGCSLLSNRGNVKWQEPPRETLLWTQRRSGFHINNIEKWIFSFALLPLLQSKTRRVGLIGHSILAIEINVSLSLHEALWQLLPTPHNDCWICSNSYRKIRPLLTAQTRIFDKFYWYGTFGGSLTEEFWCLWVLVWTRGLKLKQRPTADTVISLEVLDGR